MFVVKVISNAWPPNPFSLCRCHSVTTVSCTQSGDEPIRRSACSFRMPREATRPSIPCSPPSCWRRRQTKRSYEGQSKRRMRVVCVERARAPPLTWGHSWSRSTCGCIFFYLILFNLNLWALHYPPFTLFSLFVHLFVCLFCFVFVLFLCGSSSQTVISQGL